MIQELAYAVFNPVASVLTEVEKFLDSLGVGSGHECCVVEVSLTLFRLLGQNVAVVSVLSLDLPCAGEREALL